MLLNTRTAVFGVAALASIALSMFLTQRIWRENGLRALEAINEQRVQLVANAVRSEISRQDHLPVVLSLDAEVRAVLAAPGDPVRRDRLNRKLQHVSREADTRALYVIGPDGVVVASDDWQLPDALVGRELSHRPYFTKAVEAGRASYLGVEPASNQVRYFLAEAVRDPSLLGVAVVRIEFDALEAAWQQAGERVLVTDQNGIVFLASDPEFKYRFLGAVREPADPAEETAQYPPAGAAPISFDVLERRGSGSAVRIRGAADRTSYLYQSMALPQYGWTIHRLTDLQAIDADQRDGAIIGGALSALFISLLLYLLQRHRAYADAREAGARLQRQVAERTRELQEANTTLQSEIDERRRTEERLRAAQNELVQAGKLAALGQMSAALAHEINQPLAAIRTFMASTKIFVQRGQMKQVSGNLDLIGGLADRMAKITAHLKMFARRSEPGRPEPVLVERAVEGALFLIESQTKNSGVRIEQELEPDLWVLGYAVQLEQVLLNLVQNALDAVEAVADPWIRIQTRSSGGRVAITVSDNGHGIPAEHIARIFDPFFTTKSVGKGLGLGLSITYGIVQDFGGQLSAVNRPDGGAALTIELPRHAGQAAFRKKVLHA
jgi:two-component system C4-dicarboxylate transport sensor histidine kinase DctB